MAAGNADKQLEESLESFFRMTGRIMAAFVKNMFNGIKKLNKWQAWIGMLASGIIAAGAYCMKGKISEIHAPVWIRWLLYIALVGAPVIYLILLGRGQGKLKADYSEIFKEIDFIGKDKKVPEFVKEEEDGKKKILSFRSNIPLADWKAARARLETALDCNILKMEYSDSKKIVRLTILPADFKIPVKVEWTDRICDSQSGIITVGQSALDPITFNLNRVPHVLVAGETGSGKSVILRCMLWQMILQGSKVFMIDFKGGVEFGKQYEQYGEVITERERALEVLDMLVNENAYRLKLFRDMEVKNLSEYNRKTGQNLCRIGVFSDEIAEMLDKKGVAKEQRQIFEALEGRLSTLARLSRATGINLFLGVQRPDANILTGQIKNNIPVRISGRFADKTASEIVLGNTAAVDLPDIKGRFLYKVGNETLEFQAYYFDDDTMLHDVNVEVGAMLTEAPVYRPDKQPAPERWEERKETSEKKESTRKSRFAKKSVEKATQEKEDYGEEDYAEDEELPFGDPEVIDEFDFDFSKEWREQT